MPRFPTQHRRFWITGASSGIGRYLALELARHGARLALSGRNREALEALNNDCGGECLVLDFDVTDRDANRDAADKICLAWQGLDCAILNAGICDYVDEPGALDPELFEKTFRVNYHGMLYGAEAALGLLEHGERPQLAAMASTAALLPLPRAEAYGASKAAIRYSFHTLGARLRPRGIAVSVILPGFVRTPLTDQNDFPMPMRIEPEAAARIIRRGLERGRAEIDFPKPFSLALKALAMLPIAWQRRMMERIAP